LPALFVALVSAFTLLTGGRTEATPIGLVHEQPAFFTNATVDYDAITDHFSFTASALLYAPNLVQSFPAVASQQLAATIDENGNFSGGSFTIVGAIPGIVATPQLLLEGDLTAFGFQDDPDDSTPFEFTYTTIHAHPALGFGLAGGIILVLQDAGFGAFMNDFHADFLVDTFAAAVVAEPATVALVGVGGIVMLARRRRRP